MTKYLKFWWLAFALSITGCVAPTLLLAGGSFAATAGNQGYQAYDEWANGKKVFTCQPPEPDGRFFCKYIREEKNDAP